MGCLSIRHHCPLPREFPQPTLNPQPFEVSHTMQVAFDDETDVLHGDDHMHLSAVPQNGEARFRLNPAMTVDDVSAPWTFEDGVLTVKLPAGQAADVRVEWHGPVSRQAAGEACLYDESWWHPNHVGKHLPSQLYIVSPAPILATGQPGSTPGHWIMDQPHAGLSLIILDETFERQDTTLGDIRYSIYTPAGSAIPKSDIARESHSIIEYFSRVMGSYPHQKLDIVAGAGDSGECVPSLIHIGQSIFENPQDLNDFLPHEIAHNWWAGSVMGYSEQGLWYEAFAEMSSWMYQESQGRTDAMQARRRELCRIWTDEVGRAGATPLRDIRTYDGAHATTVAYAKGFMVLSMLRDEIGAQAFTDGLGRFARCGRGSLPTWGMAQQCFEAASGRDLSEFFKQWLDRRDVPDLSVERLEIVQDGAEWVVRGELQQHTDTPYRIKVPLQLSNGDEFVVDSCGPFEVRCSERPEALTVDPRGQILRLLREDSHIPLTAR